LGLRRGKGYCRALANEKRQAQVDRWQVYSWLKGYQIPENVANLIESAGIKEVKEGVIEYLLMKSQTGQTDDN
jgi:ribosomal protein S16